MKPIEDLARELRDSVYEENGVEARPWEDLPSHRRQEWIDRATQLRYNLNVLTRAAMTPMPPRDAA